MCKFFTVIFFSFLVTSAMAVHQEKDLACSRRFMHEIDTIYQRISTITYKDVEEASERRIESLSPFSLGHMLSPQLLRDQRDQWTRFTGVFTNETNQKLVLSVAFSYLERARDAHTGIVNISDFFRVLYQKFGSHRNNIMGDASPKTIIVLYCLCSEVSSLISFSEEQREKLVLALQSLSLQEALNLLQKNQSCSLEHLSNQISSLLRKETVTALSLRDIRTYLPIASRLHQEFPNSFELLAVLKLCYSSFLDENQREALVRSIENLHDVRENIPAAALRRRMQEVSGWSRNHMRPLTPENISDAFLALSEDYTSQGPGQAVTRWDELQRRPLTAELRREPQRRRGGFNRGGPLDEDNEEPAPGISHQSLAMEAHNYADEAVDVPAAACAAERSTQVQPH